MKLKSNKFVRVTTWLIYLPNLCQNQYSRSLYMRLACEEFIIKLCKWLQSSGGAVYQGASWSMLPRTFVRCTLFPFLGFIPLGFPSQGFNEAALRTSNTSSMILKNVVLFFPSLWLFPIGFFLSKVFNEATVIEWWLSKGSVMRYGSWVDAHLRWVRVRIRVPLLWDYFAYK